MAVSSNLSMKRLFPFLIFFVALGNCSAQERPCFISTQGNDFTTDVHDNIYIWEGSSLEKYSSEGQTSSLFSNPSYGDIAEVDASMPSKILIFYKESGIILFLDDKLSPIGNELHLFEHQMFTISHVALCNSNHIALYDESAQDLIISDLNLSNCRTTHCNFGTAFSPFLIDINFDKEIMLIDSASGIYLFDKYGTFEKVLPFKGILSAQLFGNHILYYKDSSIYKYDTSALDNILVQSCDSNIQKIERTKYFLYTLDNKGYLHKTPIAR